MRFKWKIDKSSLKNFECQENFLMIYHKGSSIIRWSYFDSIYLTLPKESATDPMFEGLNSISSYLEIGFFLGPNGRF